jgi:hypothetical protein
MEKKSPSHRATRMKEAGEAHTKQLLVGEACTKATEMIEDTGYTPEQYFGHEPKTLKV